MAIVLSACVESAPNESATAMSAATPAAVATPSLRPSPSTGLPSPQPTPAEIADGVYIAIGDSVTFGIGVQQPRSEGFPAVLGDLLATGDPPISETRVFAVPGQTATGFLEARLDDVLVAIDELGDRVELVTIGLGANELLRIRREPACVADPSGATCASAVTDATTEAAGALDTVVASVQQALDANGSDARILLLAYYNPDVEPIAVATVVGADGIVACDPGDGAPGLNDRIACVADARGVELVDLYAAFLGRENELTRFGVGDVHPNEAGHAAIAEAIAATLGVARPADGS
ncbi:MAG: SGNH/GDSL hydrolase family protein [Candidatus Limnocylindria bacterium]